MEKLKLSQVPGTFSIYKLPTQAEVPPPLRSSAFFSMTKTDEEISIVAEQIEVGAVEGLSQEPDWACLKVEGVLDFALTGILASIATPLADNQISIFAISTFNTDYILLKQNKLQAAAETLRNHHFSIDTL